ncbi:MAG: carbohydrate binding domain-containing protein [Lentisphaeria bacterium]|nr:carbohydrate binding domain-containing protein [Lentisphaeria bacterium]
MKKCFVPLMLAASFGITAAEVKDGFDKMTWGQWYSKGGKVSCRFNAKEGLTAPGSVDMIFAASHKKGANAMILKKLQVEPGKTYRVKCMVRSKTPEQKSAANIGVQAFKKGKFHSTVLASAKIPVEKDWTMVAGEFSVPNGIDQVQILAAGYADAGTTLQFDDFSMTEVDMTAEYKDTFDYDAWGFWKSPGTKVTKNLDRKEGNKAPGAAQIIVAEGNPKNKGGSLTKHFPVKPGKEYTFVVFVKSQGLSPETTIGMSIQGQDAKKRFLGTGVQGTKIKAEDCREWKRMVFTYQIPDTGKWKNAGFLLMTLGVGGSTPGCVWFDDFEFFCNSEE